MTDTKIREAVRDYKIKIMIADFKKIVKCVVMVFCVVLALTICIGVPIAIGIKLINRII